MNVKELKAALDAAKTKYEASPNDTALKALYEAAKSAYEEALAAEQADDDEKDDPTPGEKDDVEDDDSLDESKLDEKTKAHFTKLRKENGKRRTEAKTLKDELNKLKKGLKSALGGEDDDSESPEQKAKNLKGQNEALGFKTAVLEAAIEHGVSKESRKYFEFLVAEELASLGEGEELSDEKLAELAKAAKKQTAGSGGTRTSVNDDNAPNPKGGSVITLDQFVRMTVTEKSALFTKNRAKYDELFALAKEKRRL